MKTLKCHLYFAFYILALAPLMLAQVPFGPDLIPPTAQIPDPPPGATAPVAQQTTQAAAPLKPAPHNKNEVQVYGAVTDQSNAVLPNATVTLSGSGTPQTVTTNAQGQYFINATPGTYSLKIAAKGFKDFSSDGLALTAGQEIEMDGALEPAAASPESPPARMAAVAESEATTR